MLAYLALFNLGSHLWALFGPIPFTFTLAVWHCLLGVAILYMMHKAKDEIGIEAARPGMLFVIGFDFIILAQFILRANS
jgi:hypothetical protein